MNEKFLVSLFFILDSKVKNLIFTMGDTSLTVAVWFMTIALCILVLLKALKPCTSYFKSDDFKAIFAGYQHVHMDEQDPFRPV